MFKISSKYLDVVSKASIMSACLSSERDIVKFLSYQNKNKSATTGAQLVPKAIPNYLSKKRGAKPNKNVV